MTRQEWIDAAEQYQALVDAAAEAEDEQARERYERKRDACYANAVYGIEKETQDK